MNPGFERPNPWTLNICANPNVQAQIGAQTQWHRAREATAEEVALYWPTLVSIWPAYEQHFVRSGQRSIFVLEPKPSRTCCTNHQSPNHQTPNYPQQE